MPYIFQQVMLACLNVPYIWGGNNPMQGFDCSGFVLWCLTSVGLWRNGDNTAQGIYNYYKLLGEELPSEDTHPCGTLLFYGLTKTEITHIAMIVSKKFVIEAGGAGSKCKTPDEAKRLGACVRIRPFGHRKDLIAILNPHPSQKALS